MTAPTVVRCSFYLRSPIEGSNLHRYDMMPMVSTKDVVRTTTPPVAGDQIHLRYYEPLDDEDAPQTRASGSFEVVGRQWHYASAGSMDFPYESTGLAPAILDVIVVRATGLFADEAPGQLDASAPTSV